MMGDVVGNFSPNGWGNTVEDKLKYLLINYRCSNQEQSILHTNLVSMGRAYMECNHDPEAFAKRVKKDVERLCESNVFESATVETSVSDLGDGRYGINLAVEVFENNKRYNLLSILRSNDKDFFGEYDNTYFDFKF